MRRKAEPRLQHCEGTERSAPMTATPPRQTTMERQAARGNGSTSAPVACSQGADLSIAPQSASGLLPTA
jgi:hypothetical protein